MSGTLNTIEEAIEDIKAGKVIIVVDDEDRENEGDFIAAAETVTPEMINFMATHGRGLICTPLTEQRCNELELTLMVTNNTVLHEPQFTVSVDLIMAAPLEFLFSIAQRRLNPWFQMKRDQKIWVAQDIFFL